jgi:hypothetical protein
VRRRSFAGLAPVRETTAQVTIPERTTSLVARKVTVRSPNTARDRGSSIRFSAYEADEARARVLDRSVGDLEELISPQPKHSRIPETPSIYGLRKYYKQFRKSSTVY